MEKIRYAGLAPAAGIKIKAVLPHTLRYFWVKYFYRFWGGEKIIAASRPQKRLPYDFFMGIGYEAAGHAQTVRFFFRLGKQRENGGFSPHHAKSEYGRALSLR